MSGQAMEIDEETRAQLRTAGVEVDLETQQAIYAASRASVRSRSSSADQLESRPHKVTMTDARFIFFFLLGIYMFPLDSYPLLLFPPSTQFFTRLSQ